MMRTRTIQAAVMALALAASAPIAHAGGGGQGGIAGTFLFDCYDISGVNAPQELDLSDQFGERTGVKLGKAKLLCTPAGGEITSGTPSSGDFSAADHVKCYAASPKGPSPRVQKVVADPFVTEAVNVGLLHYVCVGAYKCDVGEACPPVPE
jgi:hypothetical protein